MPTRRPQKKPHTKTRQDQFLRDAAQEFANDRLRSDYHEEDELSLGRLPPSNDQEEEEEEDVSSLSSSASSSDGQESLSSSSSSSEESKITKQQQQQQQVVLESAKEYLCDHKGRELMPIQSEPRRKLEARQHWNQYAVPQKDDSKDDDSYIQNPQWYHRKRVLNSIVMILLMIAVGTAYEFFVTVEAYEHQEHDATNNNLRGGTKEEEGVSVGAVLSSQSSP